MASGQPQAQAVISMITPELMIWVNTQHEDVSLEEKLGWPLDLGNLREGFVLEMFIFRFEDMSTHLHALNSLTFRVKT